MTPSPQDRKGQRRQTSTSTRTPTKSSRAASQPQTPAVSTSDDLKALIAKRVYERYAEQGYRHGFALDDWLEAERKILSKVPPV